MRNKPQRLLYTHTQTTIDDVRSTYAVTEPGGMSIEYVPIPPPNCLRCGFDKTHKMWDGRRKHPVFWCLRQECGHRWGIRWGSVVTL